MQDLLSSTLYLLALINPISKVFVLSVLAGEMVPRELRRISIRSSLVAITILLLFAAIGNFVLERIFHVELYSLQIAAGVVLFTMGAKALFKGIFFEVPDRERLAEVSIVPLASPMIAGPSVIAATMSFTMDKGLALASGTVVIAVGANLAIMLAARPISGFLKRYNIMGALIRITGLIVATMAVQMVLSGIAEWHGTLGPAAAAGG